MAQRFPWLTGVVLAGGRSRRMGTPKAWLDAWGEPLLARTVRRLTASCAEIVVAGAPGQELPPVEARVVRDEREGDGPLRGLEAGLAATRTRAAFVCAVDVPFLQASLVERLAGRLGSRRAAVPRWEGREHPLQAVYAVDTLPVVRDLLARGLRRPADLLAAVDVEYVDESAVREVDPEGLSFLNANTLEDWDAALRRGPDGDRG